MFGEDRSNCPILLDVIEGNSFPGIEYYLPLFFEKTSTLFDYLPQKTLIIFYNDVEKHAENFWNEIKNRHEELRHDIMRTILQPNELFLSLNKFLEAANIFSQIQIQEDSLPNTTGRYNFNTKPFPNISLNHKLKNPYEKLQHFIKQSLQNSIINQLFFV